MYGGFSPCLGSWGSWGGFGFGLIGLFINLALVVGIILLVVWAVKKFTASPAGQVQTAGPAGGGQVLSAREVLDIRYARGELSREEYQQMKAELSE
ncbi:MAG: SHOCT domain-containing protein [Chloroflexi bacterium]|nr:MAG: SHOCT domain-containing protein [Chloroflexota bacterium]